MSQQTAVEWLEKEFIKLEATTGVYGKMYELIEQAKQMEKEKTEISDEEIEKEAIEHSNLYTNKFTPRNSFIMGAKWYREQLKSK